MAHCIASGAVILNFPSPSHGGVLAILLPLQIWPSSHKTHCWLYYLAAHQCGAHIMCMNRFICSGWAYGLDFWLTITNLGNVCGGNEVNVHPYAHPQQLRCSNILYGMPWMCDAV
jgi:hypothetical protein